MSTSIRANLPSEALSHLQELIQLNIDSRDGFREAADHIDIPAMKKEFMAVADERSLQATELQQFVAVNNEEPQEKGSFRASLHRVWMSVRETFTSNDAYATLAEVERGEDHIKAAYEKAIKAQWCTGPLEHTLHRQYAATKAVHDRMRDLRDTAKPR